LPQRDQEKSLRVLVHGLAYFSERLPALLRCKGWEIRYHSVKNLRSLLALAWELYRADLLFVWGARISMGKVLWLARLLRKKKVVMFWSGSDVLGAQMQFAEGKMSPWIASQIHWAGAPWLAEEIRALGLPCEYVPVTWIPPASNPVELPEVFSIATYMPAVSRGELYGLSRILRVARSLPHIPFELLGLTEGEIKNPPPNLRILGRTQDTSAYYRRASVYWRPVSHDGLSFMSLEALSHGRYVLWSYPFPHCIQSSSAETDIAELQRLHALHQAKSLPLNRSGADFVAQRFSPECIREDYLRRWREIILSPEAPSHVADVGRNESSSREPSRL